jgi:hypothetical protein
MAATLLGCGLVSSWEICDPTVILRLQLACKSPILNSILVGGPGFEPGASRSRTVSVACPGVSWRLPLGPPELKWPGPRVLLSPLGTVRFRECVIQL